MEEDRVERALQEHERRITNLEACYCSLDKKMDDMKDNIIERVGRVEKSIDGLKDKLWEKSEENSATKAQLSLLIIILTPIITGVIVYFLTR